MQSSIDGYSGTHHQLGEFEACQREIKKHSEQMQRLGNTGLRHHVQREPVQQALKLLQPAQLFTVLQNASQALNGAAISAEQGGPSDAPRLARDPFTHSSVEPLADPARQTFARQTMDNADSAIQTASARLLALLGKMAQLSSNATLQNLTHQLRGYNTMMLGFSAHYNELANRLEQQTMQWANAYDALQQAKALAETAQQSVEQAEQALNEAQSCLQALVAQAASEQETTGSVSVGLQARIADAEKTVAQAQETVNTAKSVYNDVLCNRLTPAINAEKQYKAQLQETQQQVQRMTAGLSAPQVSVVETLRNTKHGESKSLAYLMAVIAQLIGESASEDMQASAALKQKLAEAAAKDAEKRGREYEEQVRKAEEMQKTMGCIGKSIGWVITGVSFAAALFTGGASLALAGIGLALALGDEIYQAATGRSYMQEALQPIMENVVQPLIELLSKYYSNILIFIGVDKKTAESYGMIFGAIAASVLLIAGAFVAGKVMSKMAGMLIEKIGANAAAQASKEMMKNMLKKAMDSSVGQFFKRTTGSLGRSTKMSELNILRINEVTRGAYMVGSIGSGIVDTVGAVCVADIQVEAEKSRSRLLSTIALQDILNEMMERMVETFGHRLEGVNAIIENMAMVAENQMKAGQHITRKMGAIAG